MTIVDYVGQSRKVEKIKSVHRRGGPPQKVKKVQKSEKMRFLQKSAKKCKISKKCTFLGWGGSKSAKFRFFGQVEKTHFFVKISKLKANFWTSKGGVFH